MKEVFHRRFSTELGELELFASRDALTGLYFADETPTEQPGAAESDPAGILDAAEQEIQEYLAGTRKAFDLPLDFSWGTAFQQSVWRGLQNIGYGQTVSYGELARRIERPRAARAVGGANHVNPLSIIIPCHRVIAANGSLGGYGGGLWRKQALLDLEQGQPLSRPAIKNSLKSDYQRATAIGSSPSI